MRNFSADTDSLLRDIAHQALLTPEEYPEFHHAVQQAGVEIESVNMPEWPPVAYSPLVLMFGGGDEWWVDKYWEGKQPVCRIFGGDDKAHRIAREMAGDHLSLKRLAYTWQVPIYDPKKHVVLRSWLEDNQVSIVEFLLSFLPDAEKQAGRNLVFDITNPRAISEKQSGSYSGTCRAFKVQDMELMEKFFETAKTFTYERLLDVSWIRAENDSRWEARRNHEPQSHRWASHKSWIMRPLGEGVTRKDDVDAVDGYKFGPFMELFDDGTLWVWIARRALNFCTKTPLVINGVELWFAPERVTTVYCRLESRVEKHDMKTILNGATLPEKPLVQDAVKPTVQLDDIQFRQKNKVFWDCLSDLPAQFHRPRGAAMVIRDYRNDSEKEFEAELRVWGDKSIINKGINLNGVLIGGFKPRSGGWVADFNGIDAIVNFIQKSIQPSPERVPEPQPKPKVPFVAEIKQGDVDNVAKVVNGSKEYSPNSVVKAIEDHLGRVVRLFGGSASDSAITALTREGLHEFLQKDATNKMRYVIDKGRRNYDCENFSETLRVNLARHYGINSCAVIWGDGHAWNIFVVVGQDGPEIVMVEPQDDTFVVVDKTDGKFSVEIRAEVIL